MRTAFIALTVFLCWALAFGQEEQAGTTSPAIVIGFLGGYVSHTNLTHTEAHLAAEIRSAYPKGVYAAAFENRRRQSAHREILRLLDANHDGTLSEKEKQDARIVLYGHSWGASEAVALARQLQQEGIPVLLTVQVDSVAKWHENDALIPANVREAVNFYQPHGWLHGRDLIRAVDPEHTKILGNFRFDYSRQPVHCYSAYSWWDRHTAIAHTEIDCDPAVWNRVKALIRAELPPVTSATATAAAEKSEQLASTKR